MTLAVALTEDKTMEEAIWFANAAAANIANETLRRIECDMLVSFS